MKYLDTTYDLPEACLYSTIVEMLNVQAVSQNGSIHSDGVKIGSPDITYLTICKDVFQSVEISAAKQSNRCPLTSARISF